MKYIEKILEDIENGKQLKINTRPFCRYLYNYKYGCDCQENNKQCKHCILDDTLNVIKALNSEVYEKVRLTKFEYDLLVSYIPLSDNVDSVILNNRLLFNLHELGYFKEIDKDTTFDDILKKGFVLVCNRKM